jgi:hypothetical protein
MQPFLIVLGILFCLSNLLGVGGPLRRQPSSSMHMVACWLKCALQLCSKDSSSLYVLQRSAIMLAGTAPDCGKSRH